ncbi:disks large 1 tumor suppressor protein-like isoform X5 [Bubalus kerabau]|uniref:disks large 1 tumor suppressor protein-like isoform X5 n=1 Tax=Bubalus carabanensis TaxID=3119969 RepID=UPI00244EC16F|nr:disks large 1 tumor suppressor protein-like isoform X5 [Bubalus carabanensis]
MPVRKKDTDRALSLLEEYCKKLRKPEEQQLKNAVKKVMGIFKSSLFQALLDIQEFYEVTLLNSQKSCEQKIEEANQVAQKWEKTSLLTSCHDNLQKSAEWLSSKESACNAGAAGDLASIPGSVRSPGGGKATHSSILAWRIPWTEEPGELQSIGSQRVVHN